MKADDDDRDLAELELTLMNLQKESTGLPVNSGTRTDHASVYYDDTLVATRKAPVSVYSSSNQADPYEAEVYPRYQGNKRCSSFAPVQTSSYDTLNTAPRQLPTPPPQTSNSALESRESIPYKWRANGSNNGTSLKYYKEPTKRDSLMRALNSPTYNDTKPIQPSSSGRKLFLCIPIGLLLTVVYVAVTYFIVKYVSAEICGQNPCSGTAAENRAENKAENRAVLYGEVEFSRANKSWSSTSEFESNFVREMNKAVEDTVLSYYWKNATVIGFQPPISSWQKNTTKKITCRFGLNLQLDSSVRRGIATFTQHIVEQRIDHLVPDGGASVKCIVLLEPHQTHEISRYDCNEVAMTTTMTTTTMTTAMRKEMTTEMQQTPDYDHIVATI